MTSKETLLIIIWNGLVTSCQNKGKFYFQGLILKDYKQKNVLIRNSRLIFSQKVQVSLLHYKLCLKKFILQKCAQIL